MQSSFKFKEEEDLKAIIHEHHLRWEWMTMYNPDPEDLDPDEEMDTFYPAEHLEREAIHHALFRRLPFTTSG